jgi:hypothetical protein
MKYHTQQCHDNHLALKMMPSERLKQEGREKERMQNNNKAKLEQLNLSKIYLSIRP